jgi:hypothetical protein
MSSSAWPPGQHLVIDHAMGPFQTADVIGALRPILGRSWAGSVAAAGGLTVVTPIMHRVTSSASSASLIASLPPGARQVR